MDTFQVQQVPKPEDRQYPSVLTLAQRSNQPASQCLCCHLRASVRACKPTSSRLCGSLLPWELKVPPSGSEGPAAGETAVFLFKYLVEVEEKHQAKLESQPVQPPRMKSPDQGRRLYLFTNILNPRSSH